MKKLLMIAAIVAAGTAAYANTTVPVSVSLDVTKTSNLVLMEGSTLLTQIDLKHNPVLLAGLSGTGANSVATKTFTVQSGDSSVTIGGDPTKGAKITYALEGIDTNGVLNLSNGATTLASTLTLTKATEDVDASAIAGTANTITSTISAAALQSLADVLTTIEGTYTGSATLKVTAAAKTA